MSVQTKEDERESFLFQSDINQLMSLIINAFYKNKDVCFREIISNASDANEKHRHQTLQSGSPLDPSSLYIRVIPDNESKTLTVADNGIGMSKEDLINCLGTIAKSGTKDFVQSLLQAKKDPNAPHASVDQIGQFGVGFYSAYLIADRVSVVTKKEGHPAYLWESDASGSFTITPVAEEGMERGTRVNLHLKADQHTFLEKKTLTDLIKKHSEFISFPIMLMVEKEVEEEEEEEQPTEITEEEGVTEDKDTDKEKKTVKKKKTVRELEHINTQKPIWTLPPSEVTAEQYAAFYKSISNDWNDHLAVKHFNVEGSIDMKAILYLPKQIQFDMHEGMTDPHNISLYVKKVFITDESKELIPPYLCFIRGIVDCEDLPLNISREFLQNNKIVRMVQKNLVKKAIEMMTELAENNAQDYMSFYAEFARFIKHGVHDDAANRQKLEALLRYKSSRSNEDKEWRSLSEYVQDMLPEQKGIFYMSGESEDMMRASPMVEYLKEKKCEVLFMTEPIDEYVMQNITEFQGKRFICVTKNVDLFEESEEEKQKKTEEKNKYKPFCEAIKKALEKTDTLTKVDVDERVSKTEPFMVTTDAFGITANVERLLKAQSRGKAENNFMQMSRKNLLINPDHKLVRELFKQYEQDPAKMNMDLVSLMYQSALLTSGYALSHPRDFTQTIYRIVEAGFNLEDDAPIEIDLTQNTSPRETSPINDVD